MKWERSGSELEISDTDPPYKVARFKIESVRLFRASFKGAFLGDPVSKASEARAICERHNQIAQEARPNDPKE